MNFSGHEGTDMSNPSTPAPPITGTTEAVTPPQIIPLPAPAAGIPSALNFTLTGNRGLDTVIAIVLAGLSARGAEWGIEHFEVLHNYDATTITTILFGALATVAASAWAWMQTHFSQSKQAQAVMAGINLATAGNSLTVKNPDGSVSPKPVTAETAAAIVKGYADVKVTVPAS